MRIHLSLRPSLMAGLVLALALGGCDGVRRQLGLAKNAPDEFAVVSKAPLALPPDFSLRPPRPGASRPQEQQPSAAARSSLLGRVGESAAAGARMPASASTTVAPTAAGTFTAGEMVLLREAGAPEANPQIREIVNRETSILAEKERSFTDRLIFWQPEQPPGEVVDAQEEARRLRENAAAGVPVTEGETAVIERRRRGWLEGIF